MIEGWSEYPERGLAFLVSTLVVCGGNDELIPLNQGREYATKISKAKLVIIQDCGHVPPLEKPEAFLSAVTPFLK
jgi:2-hydroxy-6-oxonona-2,4-dienedioate hydrolase